MKVCLLQTDIKWSAPDANRQEAERMIGEMAGADLYVLPEMWTTGFIMEPKAVAENCDEAGLCPTAEWMLSVAESHDAAVVGSVAVKTHEGLYCNRLYFVSPSSVEYYDKRHLFAKEKERYVSGGDRVVAVWRGVRFLLQVCYDLRFPVFSRNKADYDVAIYVANWPDSRRQVWDTLLSARAIENQCYVIGVNRVGDDDMCHYDGGTTVIDAYGRQVIVAENERQQAVATVLDLARLHEFRKKFPVLADRDIFKCN